jgi:hypothetical protein
MSISLGTVYEGDIHILPGLDISLYGSGNLNVSGTSNFFNNVNLNNNIITNVTSPNNNLDVANKYYVDNKTYGNIFGNFSQGQVLFGGSAANTLAGSNILLFTNNNLILSTAGTLDILGTSNFFNTIDLHSNIITNVTSPNNNLDVANKYYVDNKTYGNIFGNFSQGQVLFGGSAANTLAGSNILLFTNNNLIVSTAGTLDILGTSNFFNTIDLHSNIITNVTSPNNNLDVANKYYVDSKTYGNIFGNFSQGQVLFGGSAANTLAGSNILLFTNNNLIVSTAGTLDILGTSNFFNTIDLHSNIITNVTSPNNNLDVANKYYVDSKTYGNIFGNFSQGQVLFGGSAANTLAGSNILLFTNNNLIVSTSGILDILGTSNFFNTIDIHSNIITNVTSPNNNLDVANKYYVDNKTYGNIFGNFSQGQVLFGGSAANTLAGSNVLLFTNNNLIVSTSGLVNILNTQYAQNLTSGTASLSIYGGVNIYQKTFLGGQLDLDMHRITQVADPILDYDAVNKKYIDNLFKTNTNTNTCEVNVNNNQTIPLTIDPSLVFDPSVYKSFYIQIYSFSNNIYTFYNIRGILENGSWILTTTYLNQRNTLQFSINNQGELQYTNNSNLSFSYLNFSIIATIQQTFINYNLANNITVFTDIPDPIFTYLNSDYLVKKLVMYVTSPIGFSVYYITLLLKASTWVISTLFQGSITHIYFGIKSNLSSGTLQYKNTNTSGVSSINIFDDIAIHPSNPVITLLPNTLDEFIDMNLFSFTSLSKTFNLYIEIPSLSKYAYYSIECVKINSEWVLNTQITGDNLMSSGIKISVFSNSTGYLKYSNTNGVPAYLRYQFDIDTTSKVLPITHGGIGSSSLFPTAILRGNGCNPIIADSQITFYNNKLILDATSGILLTNDENSINISSGSLITYGGAYIKKSLWVNDIDITPNRDDIIHEIIFNASNNIITPTNINKLIFDFNYTISFKVFMCINIITDTSNIIEIIDLYGYYKNGGWVLIQQSYADTSGIILTIDVTIGQIQYTSPNTPNWISTTVSFRAITL